MHNYKYFSHTHSHIHTDNTYDHVNKFIYIPVHTYRDVQIHSFIHVHIKKIFDHNILNRKMFSSKNVFTVKQLLKKNTQTHAQRHFLDTHTRVDQRILMYLFWHVFEHVSHNLT